MTMKVAFFSNFLNHHQLPMCMALNRLTGGNFTFVATEQIPQERRDLGYHDMNTQYPFVLRTYDSEQSQEAALQLARECDIAITGSAPELYTKIRMEHGKMTFRYAERVYKKSYIYALWPKWQRTMAHIHTVYKNAPIYMLCASAYTALDFGLSGAYLGKTYKWGYFPEVKKQNVCALFDRKKENKKTSILWAGRLIDWKHPEAAIHTARKLKKSGMDFEMRIIGVGPMEQALQKMIKKYGLNDSAHMLGAMSPEKVREHMEASDIFLFTSDRGEGWGAVLNEAMNSGCAVVASRAIGSVGFLLKNNENGIVYRNGSQRQLNQAVMKLLQDQQLRERIGRKAYRTMIEEWNADVAAERLLKLCTALQEQKKTPYQEGPCSEARMFHKHSV